MTNADAIADEILAAGAQEPAGDVIDMSGIIVPPEALTAVGEALARPSVVVNVAAHGLAAELQLKAGGLETEIATLEHAIEAMSAQLADKMKARSICAAALREYHEGK